MPFGLLVILVEQETTKDFSMPLGISKPTITKIQIASVVLHLIFCWECNSTYYSLCQILSGGVRVSVRDLSGMVPLGELGKGGYTLVLDDSHL